MQRYKGLLMMLQVPEKTNSSYLEMLPMTTLLLIDKTTFNTTSVTVLSYRVSFSGIEVQTIAHIGGFVIRSFVRKYKKQHNEGLEQAFLMLTDQTTSTICSTILNHQCKQFFVDTTQSILEQARYFLMQQTTAMLISIQESLTSNTTLRNSWDRLCKSVDPSVRSVMEELYGVVMKKTAKIFVKDFLSLKNLAPTDAGVNFRNRVGDNMDYLDE